MNFKKKSIFHRGEDDAYEPEVLEESGGVLAVWGSPGSGKTITAVKLAKMLAEKKKNVALVMCDMTAPMLPCICPPSDLECERSLGGILAVPRISDTLIKNNCITHKRLSYLTILGMVCAVSLLLFAIGAAVAIVMSNFFLVPVMAVGMQCRTKSYSENDPEPDTLKNGESFLFSKGMIRVTTFVCFA